VVALFKELGLTGDAANDPAVAQVIIVLLLN
jgi:hypothetical protein